MRPGEGAGERVASARAVSTPAPKWGLPQPVAVVAMAGGGAARFGLAALLAPATPTPTPNPTGVEGCHRWRYTLHWDRPSRLATLKNALGNSVTIYKDYKAPGAGTQDDWPDPITNSIDWSGAANAGAWDYKTPPAAAKTTAAYDHDCDSSGYPACPVGEQPGIFYEAGWAGKIKYGPATAPAPGNQYPIPVGPIGGVTKDPNGDVVDWQWTLNYGYGKVPANDIIYGLDPGRRSWRTT